MKLTDRTGSTAGQPLQVVEGIAGTWFYHLAEPGRHWESLCGHRTMSTGVPLKAWGSRSHLRERWCDRCAAKAAERGVALGTPTESDKAPAAK